MTSVVRTALPPENRSRQERSVLAGGSAEEAASVRAEVEMPPILPEEVLFIRHEPGGRRWSGAVAGGGPIAPIGLVGGRR